MKFIEYTVQELIDMNMLEKPTDGNHGNKHPKNSDYVNQGVPFIMVSDIVNGKIDYNKCKFISKNQRNKLDKGFSKPGDILLSHKATIGVTTIVDNSYPEIVITPQLTYYRVKEKIDKYYLKYYFDSPYFQNILKNWATSGSTRAYLGITAQLKLPILLPNLQNQHKIARILATIDKKIELNTQINNNLYEIMKRIFDNWVNNLDNYEESSLSKIANYINGLAMQKYRAKNEMGLPVIKIKEMNEGITNNTERCSSNIKEDYIIEDGDILFAWSGTLCMTIWAQGKAGLNQHIFKVQSKKYPKWFYYLWTEYYLGKFVEIAVGKATTMGHIKRKELDTAKVKIPIKKEMDKMDRIMQPMLDKYINNKINNEILKQVRDTLLPKLMKGEIDLDKIEI